jgi:hypothetical protein
MEYKPEYNRQAEKLCRILNVNIAGIAYFFSTTEDIIQNWIENYNDFANAIKVGYDSRATYLINKALVKEKRNKRRQKNVADSPKLRIRNNIAAQMHYHLKTKNGRHVFDLLGYSCENLMIHLESKFKTGMNWDNYGKYWHVDHKMPASWFIYENAESDEFKKCWALSNLQPLEAHNNIKKNNKYASA